VLPTGGKGHGGDEEDFLAFTEALKTGLGCVFICLLSGSAQERLTLLYLLAFGSFGFALSIERRVCGFFQGV
jgi:hypothetical protein